MDTLMDTLYVPSIDSLVVISKVLNSNLYYIGNYLIVLLVLLLILLGVLFAKF